MQESSREFLVQGLLSTMWDAVVIGLGGVGSFALRELSLRTRNQGRAAATRVLGLEAFERNFKEILKKF